MLKKVMICAVALLVISQAGAAFAADLKIGVVDLGEVLKQSDAGGKAFAQIKAQFEKMGKDLERKKAEIEKMGKELQKQRMVLSLEAKQDKEIELKRQARDYEDMAVEYQRRMKADQEKLTEPIFKLLQEVVTDYCTKGKFDLVLERAPRGSGVIYAAKTLDITPQITAELNKAWKAKGGK